MENTYSGSFESSFDRYGMAKCFFGKRLVYQYRLGEFMRRIIVVDNGHIVRDFVHGFDKDMHYIKPVETVEGSAVGQLAWGLGLTKKGYQIIERSKAGGE